MTKTDPPESEPLVLDASLTGDSLALVLTREGYETIEEALELLRETNPQATYGDVLDWMLRNLIDELEADMN